MTHGSRILPSNIRNARWEYAICWHTKMSKKGSSVTGRLLMSARRPLRRLARMPDVQPARRSGKTLYQREELMQVLRFGLPSTRETASSTPFRNEKSSEHVICETGVSPNNKHTPFWFSSTWNKMVVQCTNRCRNKSVRPNQRQANRSETQQHRMIFTNPGMQNQTH